MKVVNKTGYRFIEWKVKQLLKRVPANDLDGLKSIVLLRKPKEIERSKDKGAYYPKWENNETPYIELYVDNIFEGNYSFFALLFPFLGSFIIGEVLFHEIGHHCHGEEKNEIFARELKAETYVTTHLLNFMPPLLIRVLVRWLIIYPFCLLLLIVLRTRKSISGQYDHYSLLILAQCYNNLGSHSNAKLISEELIKKGYRGEKPYLFIGEYYWKKKNNNEAISWWKKGAELSAYHRICRRKFEQNTKKMEKLIWQQKD